ncbi:MAG: hypothetical protein ACYC63_04815 [Armatimonadota bacterium]
MTDTPNLSLDETEGLDVMDEEETLEEEEIAAPMVEIDPMALIRAIAGRASLGHTDTLKLKVPGMGEIDDPRFGIMFNDADSQTVDAWMDAMRQITSTENMQVDDETGLVVGEQKTEQHQRAWPMLDVVIDYNLVREATLPYFKKTGELAVYTWSKSPTRNRTFMRLAKQMTISTLLSMAGDHIIGGESTQALMSQLGE